MHTEFDFELLCLPDQYKSTLTGQQRMLTPPSGDFRGLYLPYSQFVLFMRFTRLITFKFSSARRIMCLSFNIFRKYVYLQSLRLKTLANIDYRNYHFVSQFKRGFNIKFSMFRDIFQERNTLQVHIYLSSFLEVK